MEKIKNLVKGLKDLTTIGSANIIAAIISGIFWFYMAALLGTEEFGKVNYYIAIATIAYMVSYLGAGNTVLVYTVKDNKIQSSVYFISIISSIITSIVLFFIFYNLGVSLFVIGSVIFGLATSELLAKKLYKDFSKYVISQRILLLGLSVGLYFLMGSNGVILGFALSYFPYFTKIYKGFRQTKIDTSILKPRAGFMMNSYALDLSNVLSTFADKLFIFPLFGYALLGNYSLGMQLLMILAIMPITVYQYILPNYAGGIVNNKIKKVTILASVIFAIFGMVLFPHILSFLFPKFKEATEIIQIMSLAIIPITINYMYNARFLGMEKSKYALIGACIYLSVQISGIFILGKIYGINGAATALVLGAGAQSVFLVVLSKIIKPNISKI